MSEDRFPLPPRDARSHKGDFGQALLIGGSRGMSGAIGLAALATLRGGAGRVTVATPSSSQPIVAALEPSYMTWELPEDRQGRLRYAALHRLQSSWDRFTCLACGPGLGQSIDLVRLVQALDARLLRPLVLDADGLNALAQTDLQHRRAAPGARILTPHPGEFARLTGEPAGSDDEQRVAAAETFAETHQVVLVLKGYRTVVTDGSRTHLNATGNPGLATGGSGDILTGIITALVCQGLEPWEAARWGVHLHGLAADRAVAQWGVEGLIASDLPAYLGPAIQELRASQSP